MLIASGTRETAPLTVGFSKSSALPPPGDFHFAIRPLGDLQLGGDGLSDAASSPARSSAVRKAEKDSWAIRRGWELRVKGASYSSANGRQKARMSFFPAEKKGDPGEWREVRW